MDPFIAWGQGLSQTPMDFTVLIPKLWDQGNQLAFIHLLTASTLSLWIFLNPHLLRSRAQSTEFSLSHITSKVKSTISFHSKVFISKKKNQNIFF